jgi:hypothetical protein
MQRITHGFHASDFVSVANAVNMPNGVVLNSTTLAKDNRVTTPDKESVVARPGAVK